MRSFAIVLSVLSLPALAFDQTSWLAKRATFQREAERLQAAYRDVAARLETPAENVVVPLEIHPDGSVKLQVEAKRAQIFLKERLVWGEGVVFREYDERGGEKGRIAAARCLFDRASKAGWAEGPAKIVRDTVVFEGEDVFFSADEEYVMSFKDSSFNASDVKTGGLR